MTRTPRLMIITLFKSLLLSSAVSAAELSEGDSAPDFQLLDQNSQSHSLEDYRDHWLVLYFYPKNDTPGCTTEACSFRDDYFKLKALGARVVGVSLDDSASHEAFTKKYSLPFPLLADLQGETAKAYGALWKLGPIKFARRHSFIIDPQGKIQKIYRDVDPDTHSQQIIDELKRLQAKQAE